MIRLVVGLCVASIVGCRATPPQNGADAHGDPDRIPVLIHTDRGAVTFLAEIADTPALRQKGLMFRRALGDNEGMLFLFPNETHLSFWMRNTLISLDMIFVRSDKTILGIVERAEPQADTPRAVSGNSQFVLEVAGGTASALGISPGQKVEFFAPIPAL